ncbi:hypothetical protein BDD12DRAFT_548107 [Trichophaea hybrida]|nr:hypothetical protein BDD12DRAFT_548107 [Trichophaea hybrida]
MHGQSREDRRVMDGDVIVFLCSRYPTYSTRRNTKHQHRRRSRSFHRRLFLLPPVSPCPSPHNGLGGDNYFTTVRAAAHQSLFEESDKQVCERTDTIRVTVVSTSSCAAAYPPHTRSSILSASPVPITSPNRLFSSPSSGQVLPCSTEMSDTSSDLYLVELCDANAGPK